MSKEIENLKNNIDSWIKDMMKELGELNELANMVTGNADDIQYNFELIYELKDEIEELKQEVNALKWIQIISLKQKEKTGHASCKI